MDVHTKKYIYRILTRLICNIFKNGYLRKGFPGKQITTKKQVPRHFLTETKYDILVLKKESCKKEVTADYFHQFSAFPQKHTISLEFLK